jgi:hypothetical protein
LTTGPPHRRLPLRVATLALALTAAVLAIPTISQARRASHRHSAASCPSSTRSKHRGHACAGRARGQKPHGRRSPAAKHGGVQSAIRPGTATRPRSASTAGLVAAGCEEGSNAAASPQGTLSCSDGSEPGCEDGSIPPRSSGGTALVCPVPAESDPGAGEIACEDAAVNPCADGSEEFPDAVPVESALQQS